MYKINTEMHYIIVFLKKLQTFNTFQYIFACAHMFSKIK